MKIILFVIGAAFAYWNYSCLSENILAVWHFVALVFTLMPMGYWFSIGFLTGLPRLIFPSKRVMRNK